MALLSYHHGEGNLLVRTGEIFILEVKAISDAKQVGNECLVMSGMICFMLIDLLDSMSKVWIEASKLNLIVLDICSGVCQQHPLSTLCKHHHYILILSREK